MFGSIVGEPVSMQIIVHDTKNFTELELCLSVANAIAQYTGNKRLSNERNHHYVLWSAGDSCKVVRRARGALWDKLLAKDEGYFHHVPVNDSLPELIIVPPAPVDTMSRNIRESQMGGLVTLPDTRSYITNATPLFSVYTNTGVGLSSEERASAVAHTVQLMVEKLTVEDFDRWRKNGYQLRISGLGMVTSMAVLSSVFVIEGGCVEVGVGTVMALGVWAEIPPLSMEQLY